MGIFDKGVKKTNRGFFDRLSHAIVGRTEVDDDVMDAIEEALLATDMGVDTTLKIIDNLEDRVRRDKYVSMSELVEMLREEIADLLNVDDSEEVLQPFDFSKKPYVIMVVGVNGVGKTTTIGKLASSLKAQGKKVMLGAADTFRAAAVDQLTVWSERAGVEIVKQAMGSDPASVAFDTLKSAVAKDVDVVLIDTAGCVPFSAFEKLLDSAAGFLFDFKTADPEKYRRIGGDLQLVQDNLGKLLEKGAAVQLRIPLIPGFNTAPEEIDRCCAALQDLSVSRVELLPFHRLGSGKYEAMGLVYAYRDCLPLTKAELQDIENRYSRYFQVITEI